MPLVEPRATFGIHKLVCAKPRPERGVSEDKGMSKYYLLIVITVILNATSQLLMKAGMAQVGQAEFSTAKLTNLIITAATHPLVILGLATMTISMVTHLMALSRFDVSFVFPFISIAYVIVAVWGGLVMGENVNAMRIVGISTVLVGTILIARS